MPCPVSWRSRCCGSSCPPGSSLNRSARAGSGATTSGALPTSERLIGGEAFQTSLSMVAPAGFGSQASLLEIAFEELAREDATPIDLARAARGRDGRIRATEGLLNSATESRDYR